MMEHKQLSPLWHWRRKTDLPYSSTKVPPLGQRKDHPLCQLMAQAQIAAQRHQPARRAWRPSPRQDPLR